MAEKDSLNTHSEKLQRMLKARDSVKKNDEVRQAQEEDITDSKPVEDDDEDGPQVAGEATSAMHDVLDLQQNTYSACQHNCPQLLVFALLNFLQDLSVSNLLQHEYTLVHYKSA